MPIDPNQELIALALWAGLIDPNQLSEARAACAAGPGSPLADLLQQRGWLTPQDRDHLEHLVQTRCRKQGSAASTPAAAAAESDPEQTEAAGPAPQAAETPLPPLPPVPDSAAFARPLGQHYRDFRPHARGGLGQVLLARDEDIGREVAVKELRPEVAHHPEMCRRFVAEARITGQLEHPGVVPVYEMGSRGRDGQPVYVMRFLRGRTLSAAVAEYHRRRSARQTGPLDLLALLNAFVAVCNTVAYAHARGVIHRDLKGANIILGNFGEVFVLDWGLAKLVGQPEGKGELPPVALASEEVQTLMGQVLGTPAYMAPEQAAGRVDRIDHRTDVYALGAILYEVLTGRPPFVGAGTPELLRRICEEPPTPPRQFAAGIPAPLEAVCLKALAKRPADRYASAGELAAEVQRWLADEPVRAYPEPLATKLWRWARRHRPWVYSAAALLLTALAALAVSNVLIGRERQRTELARQQAVANFRTARDAVDRFHTRVSEERLLNEPGLQPLRKDLLQMAQDFYQKFVAEGGEDPDLRADLGRALLRSAQITSDVDSRDRAVALVQQARDVFQELVQQHPEEADYSADLGRAWKKLGAFHHLARQSAAAEPAYVEALRTFEEVARAHPENLDSRSELAVCHSNLGALHRTTGKLDAAEADLKTALAQEQRLVEEAPANTLYQRDLAGTWTNLGQVLADRKDVKGAEGCLQKALAVRAKLAGEHPKTIDYRNDLAAAHNNLGVLYGISGQLEAAADNYRKARTIRAEVAAANPSVTQYQLELTGIDRNLGNLYYRIAQQARADGKQKESEAAEGEAQAAFTRALTALTALTESYPQAPQFAAELGTIYSSIGNLVYDTNPRKSLPWYEKAIKAVEKVRAAGGDTVEVRGVLRNSYWGRAGAAGAGGQLDLAAADWRQALLLDDGSQPGLREEAGDAAKQLQGKLKSAEGLWNLAGVWALLSTQAPPGDAEAASALDALRRARTAGPSTPGDMRQRLGSDPALAGIRSRDDFQALLRETEKQEQRPQTPGRTN